MSCQHKMKWDLYSDHIIYNDVGRRHHVCFRITSSDTTTHPSVLWGHCSMIKTPHVILDIAWTSFIMYISFIHIENYITNSYASTIQLSLRKTTILNLVFIIPINNFIHLLNMYASTNRCSRIFINSAQWCPEACILLSCWIKGLCVRIETVKLLKKAYI